MNKMTDRYRAPLTRVGLFASTAMLVCALVILAACTDRAALQRQAQTPPARRLVGIWRTTLHLDQSLVSTSPPLPKNIRGEIALLANPWLHDAHTEITSPTHYGTFDVDFTTFGFDPRDPGQVPAVIALLRDDDSVELVLVPGQPKAVVLDGVFRGDSIVGSWQASPLRIGGVSGHFVMTRQ